MTLAHVDLNGELGKKTTRNSAHVSHSIRSLRGLRLICESIYEKDERPP